MPLHAWPTLGACALALALFALASHRLTQGFEYWTFDGLRRADAARGRLVAPATAVTTSSGERLTLWSGAGGDAPVYLVDFVYTRCPSVCQALGSEYAQMQAKLLAAPPGRGMPKLLSLSFDVERDRREQLAAYAKRHGADPALWTVAVPASRDERDRLLERLGVVVVPDGFGGYVHNASLLVVDAGGRVHGVFDFADWPRALHAARRLGAAAS
jgi:protein SCO1/2